MSVKTEWVWLVILGLVNFITVGLMTNFIFDYIEIQLLFKSYSFNAFNGIIYSTVILWTIKNGFMLINALMKRYIAFAIIILVVCPIIILFGVAILYFSTNLFLEKINSDLMVKPLNSLVPLVLITGFIIGLILIEIKSFKEAFRLIGAR